MQNTTAFDQQLILKNFYLAFVNVIVCYIDFIMPNRGISSDSCLFWGML